MPEPTHMTRALTDAEIATYVRYGVLVADDLLEPETVEAACQGLHATLSRHGIDADNLASTGHALANLSSTHGSGGVLDIFYDDWKLQLAAHAGLFAATTQLWRATYYHAARDHDSDGEGEGTAWPPDQFDVDRGYCYIDRVGYRLPTVMAEKLGTRESTKADGGKRTSGRRNPKPLQRSLTPHLDCCPDTFYDANGKHKWRPIQCFISLSDSLEADTGGFEAALGFQREFDSWREQRPSTVLSRHPPPDSSSSSSNSNSNSNSGARSLIHIPAPCIGEYTHIRPVQDRGVLERVQHVPVRRGSVVFWDQRMPHANAYRHQGHIPRAVVYCSFLPDVAINQAYVAEQLRKWKHGINPTDQWINGKHVSSDSELTDTSEIFAKQAEKLSLLARKLYGIDPW